MFMLLSIGNKFEPTWKKRVIIATDHYISIIYSWDSTKSPIPTPTPRGQKRYSYVQKSEYVTHYFPNIESSHTNRTKTECCSAFSDSLLNTHFRLFKFKKPLNPKSVTGKKKINKRKMKEITWTVKNSRTQMKFLTF